MTRWVLILASILCAALITAVVVPMGEGFSATLLLIFVWDFSPLGLVVLIALFWCRLQSAAGPLYAAMRTALLVFCIASLALTGWEYLDFLIARPTSSTSALAFLFYPILAVGGGILGGLIASGAAFFIRRHKITHAPSGA
jgi:hypothetical protein